MKGDGVGIEAPGCPRKDPGSLHRINVGQTEGMWVFHGAGGSSRGVPRSFFPSKLFSQRDRGMSVVLPPDLGTMLDVTTTRFVRVALAA